MTEDKTAITGYFDLTEEEVIAAYADKHRITESKALEALVKKGIEPKAESLRASEENRIIEEKYTNLNANCERLLSQQLSLLNRLLALETEIETISRSLDEVKSCQQDVNENRVSDERIAAVTGQSEWKVKLWRHGIQKPRGKIIKQKLKAYTVKDGVWMKR